MPRTAPYISVLLDQWIKYVGDARPELQLAVARPRESRARGPAGISELSTQLDTKTDISAFARHGRQAAARARHGRTSLVSTRATEQYYQRLQSADRTRRGRHLRPLLRSARLRPRRQHVVQRRLGFADGARELGREGRRAERPGRDRHRRRAGPHAAAVRLPEMAAVQRLRRRQPRRLVHLRRTARPCRRRSARPRSASSSARDNSATSGTYAWKGVPFAKAPVGDLRWKPPVDPAPWTSPKSTQQFGNACVAVGPPVRPRIEQQVRRHHRHDARPDASGRRTVSISTSGGRPARRRELPVIVLVHGGSNITGYTADPMYDGATSRPHRQCRRRHGELPAGRARLPQHGPAEDRRARRTTPATSRILDIIKALQFVNGNIASFGGDPGNVTLMGESAGAVNVYAVMTSPLVVAANPSLVHRVLPMSGGISLAERAAGRQHRRRWRPRTASAGQAHPAARRSW